MEAPETVEHQNTIVVDSLPEALLSVEEISESEFTRSPVDEREIQNQQVLERARAGDEEATSHLYRTFRPLIASAAVPRGANSIDRDDLIQSANERIYKDLIKRPDAYKVRSVTGIVAWLSRNAGVDMLRHNQSKARHSICVEDIGLYSPTDDSDPAEQSNPEDTYQRMVDFLQRSGCTQDQIEPILLTQVYGCTYEEAASITGVKLGTVRTRISRGLKNVRDSWGIPGKGQRKVRDIISMSEDHSVSV
jgi:RNA polymerase sigma-70 factor (ECF subfamily)